MDKEYKYEWGGGGKEEEECIWVIVGKSEGKRPLGRPRLRLVVSSLMDPGEIGCCGLD
jgi:hypothetical protein